MMMVSQGSDPGRSEIRGRRFRHWRLYGGRGLAGERVAVWVWDGTVTIEYAAETLAEYPVAFGAHGRQIRELGEPRLFATGHASPQPFLSPLDETEWHPARRLAPYRPRRRSEPVQPAPPLFGLAEGA